MMNLQELATAGRLYRLPLEAEKHEVSPGLNGSLLLLEGNQLRRLGADGLVVRETFKLPKIYTHIGERADSFVAISDATDREGRPFLLLSEGRPLTELF